MEKVLVGVLLAAFAAIVMWWKRPLLWRRTTFWTIYAASLIAMRAMPFVLFFLAFGTIRATGDVPEYYYPQAQSVLQNMLPIRDFPVHYGPLFPYVCALVVSGWNSPTAIVLFSILMELASVFVWIVAAQECFEETTVRKAALLYATSLLPIANVGVSGQNQVWVSFFVAVSTYVLLKGRPALSGMFLGMSVILVKILGGLFAPILAGSCFRWRRWLGAFGVTVLGVYALFVLLGANPLLPLLQEAHMHSPGNISFFLTIFGFSQDTLISKIASYGTVGLLFALVTMRLRTVHGSHDGHLLLFHSIAFMYLVFALFSPKSYTYYAMICFFPICLAVSHTTRALWGIFLFALFGILLVVEPNLWQAWFLRHDFQGLFFLNLPKNVSPKGAVGFLVAEALLLFLYCYYGVRIWRAILAPRRVVTPAVERISVAAELQQQCR
jgi:hypothetical protein